MGPVEFRGDLVTDPAGFARALDENDFLAQTF